MTKEKKIKGLKETYAQFFENPSREALRKLLVDHTGEHDELDFKSELIEIPKLAKHILGIANKSGGIIIFGVKEDNGKLESIGLQELNDKTHLFRDCKKYLPEKLEFDLHDFYFEESEYPKLKGKNFRVLIVEYTPEYIPFISQKEGENIKSNTIYIRRNSSTEIASYQELQDIFNRRLETNYSSAREITLVEHFKELKEIYSLIEKGDWLTVYEQHYRDTYDPDFDDHYVYEQNPRYPKEDYEDFVVRMIALKKLVIESIVKTDKYMR